MKTGEVQINNQKQKILYISNALIFGKKNLTNSTLTNLPFCRIHMITYCNHFVKQEKENFFTRHGQGVRGAGKIFHIAVHQAPENRGGASCLWLIKEDLPYG